MVQRRAEKNPLLIPISIAQHLQNHRERLGDEDRTGEGQDDFAAQQKRRDAKHAAEGEGAGIAHEDLRRVAVVPQKAEAGAGHSEKVDADFAAPFDVEDVEVTGEVDVVGEKGEEGEHERDHDETAGSQAIEAVSEVHGVGGAGDDEQNEKKGHARRKNSDDPFKKREIKLADVLLSGEGGGVFLKLFRSGGLLFGARRAKEGFAREGLGDSGTEQIEGDERGKADLNGHFFARA